jgi:soluble lytic murein transglycosylase
MAGEMETQAAIKTICRVVFIAGLLGALPTAEVRANAPGSLCTAEAECFGDAVRALHNKDAASANALLLELIQQFPNTPWAARSALILGRYFQEHGDRQSVVYLISAQQQLPLLGDYAYYYLGEALFGFSDWNGAASAYDLLSVRYPDSLLRPQALYRAAEAWFQGDDCRRARERHIAFLSGYPRHALAPAILLRQGDCEQKEGDQSAAIATYRRIWIQFAAASQSTEAAFRLQALKDKGVALPDVNSQDWWTRGKALFDAGQYVLAVSALQDALKASQGLPDRPQALLTLGIARIRLKQYDEARPILVELVRNRSGAVSQEAALWLARVYLRQGDQEPFLALAREVDTGLLGGELKAKFLLLLGAEHADRGRIDTAVSTYRQAAAAAETTAVAADALWQIGWLYYSDERYAQALGAFEESRRGQSSGSSVIQALYWKARTLEKMGERQKAFETFQSICSESRNSYYCQIGRTRNGWAQISGHETAGVKGPLLAEALEPQNQALMTDIHYQRATELRLIGWLREAADELSTLTMRTGQDRAVVLWLARLLNSTGEYHRALSLIRTFFADVLERGGTAGGKTFWELAYPGGYLKVIHGLPASQRLDTFLITAVIREESSYNPSAVSSAGALGLMQVMPQTGSKIASELGSPGFTRERLFEPCYNIRLGSWYLRQLSEKFGNNLVLVIAAYNAGPEAVSKWVQQRRGKDQDEFVESIPYTETRNYVKKVLRSYGEYKRIYGSDYDIAGLTSPYEPGIFRCEGSHVVE